MNFHLCWSVEVKLSSLKHYHSHPDYPYTVSFALFPFLQSAIETVLPLKPIHLLAHLLDFVHPHIAVVISIQKWLCGTLGCLWASVSHTEKKTVVENTACLPCHLNNEFHLVWHHTGKVSVSASKNWLHLPVRLALLDKTKLISGRLILYFSLNVVRGEKVTRCLHLAWGLINVLVLGKPKFRFFLLQVGGICKKTKHFFF